jgi:hypothetical protein
MKNKIINQKGFVSIVIILIIIGILIVAGGFIILSHKNRPNPNKPASTPTPKPAQPEQSVSIPTPEEKLLGPIDCGTSIDCLISASKTCSPAKAINTVTFDIFGVKQTRTSFLEIKGKEAGKCIFYLRTEKIDLAFPPSIPQEVINQQKAIYKKLEGRDGTCKFNPGDLTAMLTRWKEGTFESGTVSCKLTPSGNICKTEGGDFGVAECKGKYFEQFTQEEQKEIEEIIYGKRIPANTSVKIGLSQCPYEAERLSVQEDGTMELLVLRIKKI